jgi:hypothetical protein
MATRTSRSSRRSSRPTHDMSDYDPDGGDYGGGGGFHIPDGEYPMKVESCTQKTSKNDSEMYEWIFVGTGGKAKGKKFFLYTVFDDIQKLGKTWEAVGYEFEPGGEVDFDPDSVEDAECIGEVYTDEYNGEKRSKLRKVMSADEAGGKEEEEEEEEKPARGSKKANGKTRRVVKMSEDEVKELDEEELEALVDKHELEVDLAKAKTLSKKRNAVLEALTEADLIA